MSVDADLARAAAEAGALVGRSADAQIARWIRLGRAVEDASIPSTPIGAVIARELDFDALTVEDQASVAEIWNVLMAARIAALDLAAEFEASGAAHAYLDDDGHVVEVPAREPRERSRPDAHPT